MKFRIKVLWSQQTDVFTVCKGNSCCHSWIGGLKRLTGDAELKDAFSRSVIEIRMAGFGDNVEVKGQFW